MRLMEILKEASILEEAERLDEKKKKARGGIKKKIQAKYNAKMKQAGMIAKKLRAKKGKINWSDEVKDTRNEVVSAFMANDIDKVLGMMQGADGYKTVEILKALATAHGGYEKLERKAGQAGKKDFIKTVFAYIDDNKEAEEA